MDKKDKPKIAHGQLYKNSLWATIIVFSLATLVTVFAILFDGFTSFTGRMLFVMWQVFWFGILAILFARFYERNTFALARGIAVAGVISCAVLLMIGVYQAMFPESNRYHYVNGVYTKDDIGILVSKIQYILAIFVYAAVFVEWHLMVRSNVQAVIVARDITAGVMMVAVLILDILILTEFDDASGIMLRFVVVTLILAVTGAVVTRILAAIYDKNNKPTENIHYGQVSAANNNISGNTVGTIQVGAGNDAKSTVNRAFLLRRLQELTGRDESECMVIANVFENGFLTNKQSKEEMTKGLMTSLAMDEAEAGKIYDGYISMMMAEFLQRK